MVRLKLCMTAIALATIATTVAAIAQEGAAETVVVTGERRNSYTEIPHIFLTRRADHLITQIHIVCDTLDKAQRHAELKSTLRSMMHLASADSSISLGIGDRVLADLNEKMLDDVIEEDSRPETSYADVVIKTAISKIDSLDVATGRIRLFIASIDKAGRTVIARQGSWDLTLIGPGTHRDELLKRIADDAKETAAQFGSGYGVWIDGLQNPITWQQIGPLELALYIPYTLHIQPIEH